MAEESLVAELRLGYQKFQNDLRQAQRVAESQSRDIANSLGGIDRAIKDLPSSFNQLNAGLRQSQQQMRATSQETSRFAGVLTSLKGTLAAIGLSIGVREAAQFAGSMSRGGDAVINLENQLRVMTGSAQGAAQAMAFAAGEANRLSQDTLLAQQSFTQIVAAARDTAIEGKGAEIIFTGLSNAITATGKSGSDFQRVLNQVVQGMNKGKVEMEDLRVIAENNIPAQKLLAEAMGITGEALADAMRKGAVGAEAFILLGARLTELYGEIGEAAANRLPGQFRRGINQIRNEFRDLFAAIFESGALLKAASPLFDVGDLFPSRQVMTNWIDETTNELVAFAALIESIFSAIHKFIVRDFDNSIKTIRKIIDPLLNQFGKWGDEIKEKFGLATKEAADTAVAELEQVGQSMEDLQSKRWQGLIPLIFGVEDDDPVVRLQKLTNEIRKLGGLEPIEFLNPKKTGPAAKEATEVIEDEYKKLEEKINKLLSDRLNAPSEAELAKRKKAIEKSAQELRDLVVKENDRIAQEGKKAEEMAREAMLSGTLILPAIQKTQKEKLNEYSDELIQLLREHHGRIAREAQEAQDIAIEAMATGKTVLPPLDPEMFEDIEAIFETMRENIQSNLADILTDVFSGQIDSIQDVADTIVQIMARMAAEIIVAMAIRPVLESAFKDFENALKAFSGEEIQAGTGDGTAGKPGGGLIKAAAGVAAGAAIAQANPFGSQMASNIIGGAISGASIGAQSGGYYGAAIGAVAGALAGLTASLLNLEKKIRIAPLTSATVPTTNVEQGVSTRSPFGHITLVDQSSTTEGDTRHVTALLAEVDSVIARHLNQRQREIVGAALQAQHYFLDAKEMDDAIAQAIQTRLFIVLREVAGEAAAINIVGDPYTGTSENIELLQKRALEALAIIETIEEFKIADMGDVAMQIHELQKQFNDLIDRANQLGLDVQAAELAGRRDQEIQRITDDFNIHIRNQILGFTDPAQQAAEELRRMQDEIFQDAVAAGADMEAVYELFNLQWEEHNARFGAAGQEGLHAIAALTDSIEQFGRANLSSTTQQLIGLRDRFEELHAEAVRLNHGVEQLTASYHEQRDAIITAAQRNVAAAIMGIVNPFEAAMIAIQAQVEEFQRLANEGLIGQETVDWFRQAAEEQAKYNEAIRIASGSSTNAAQSFNQMISDFVSAGSGLSAVQREINGVITQFDNLVIALHHLASTGAITQEQLAANLESITESRNRQIAAIEKAERERKAQERRQEAEQRRQEREQRRQEREQVKRSIEAFGNVTLSGAGQQFANLAQNFRDLYMEARRLGVGTRELIKDYKEQARQIQAQAQASIMGAIFSITNPFAAAMMQVNEQVREFQKMANEGFISHNSVREYERLAREDARYQAANQIATSGVSTSRSTFDRTIRDFTSVGRSSYMQEIEDLREQLANLAGAMKLVGRSTEPLNQAFNRLGAEIIEAAQREIYDEIDTIVNPWAVAMREINDETEHFKQIANEGLISPIAVRQLKDLRLGLNLVDEALRRISGGPINTIGQVAEAFDQFIRAGNPLSSAGQELYDLTENFLNLADAAHLLGFSTKELRESYMAQSQVIRDRIIEDIDNQLSAQIQAIESIGKYLDSLRVAEEQPLNIRLDEAQAQFQAALGGDDVSEIISAAQTLRDIARQQFGAGREFFTIENQIVAALSDIQAREQAIVEAERQRLTDQIDREIRGLQIGQSSLDQLQRVAHYGLETSRGVDEMVSLARQAAQREQATINLLERVLAEGRR